MSTFLDQLFGLHGRRAVVTGASSGMGRACAIGLARAGATVTLVGRDESRLEQARALCGDAARWVAADLGSSAELEQLCASQTVANADILVCCAGVNLRPPLAETSEDELAQTMAVNLEAPYRLGNAAGPRMAERGWGRIINVGSQQSWSAFGNSGVYGMSKAGLAGLTRSQAEAWSASGVTSNTLIPGFVITPMTRGTIAEAGREQALADRTLVGRNGLPDDIVGAAIFLASPAAAFVTGQMLAVDGGFSVH